MVHCSYQLSTSLVLVLLLLELTASLQQPMMGRRNFINRLSALTTFWSLLPLSAQSLAFQPASNTLKVAPEISTPQQVRQATAAYKPLSLSLPEAEIPVACWFPVVGSDQGAMNGTPPQVPTYSHRISVRKIGQLLANWNNIPGFVFKDYSLRPTSNLVLDGSDLPLPTQQQVPVVILAHGYLGSRFDLSHLAETLAGHGFLCMAAEYPESLAASYDPPVGLDRTRINQALLDTLTQQWKIQASSYGIVGHSLGCGTALQTGDASWTRVLISGFPRQRDGSPLGPGNLLLLMSMNDGVVNRFLVNSKENMVPSDFSLLQEADMKYDKLLPSRSMLLFDRPDAPNHISFLSEGVNDAMIEFLSPLLPVARMFDIPVLDFDRYQESRDSKVTAEVVLPIVLRYLQQEMKPQRI